MVCSKAVRRIEVPPLSAATSPFLRVRRILLVLLLILLLVLLLVLADELRSSRRQATYLSGLWRDLSFRTQPGPSTDIRYPGRGPYDQRLGYSELPRFAQRLSTQGFEVVEQARMSQRMLALRDMGLFAPYPEKDQAGLWLTDCHGDTLFEQRYPERTYPGFEAVPKALVNALLFIENRELLDADHPTRNPAVEWDRFTRAAVDQARQLIDDSHRAPGGSTLATQIEKYRHSPEGRTDSGAEKLRQMGSASVRAYMNGRDTLPWRRRLVVTYLNTVPLSARAGFGEVHGLGDGLWAWYGRDFDELNRLLLSLPVDAVGSASAASAASAPATRGRPVPPAAALAFKQALSLMIAQRRPSGYLVEGERDLNPLTDSYLRLMADAGFISAELRDAALRQPLTLAPQAPSEPVGSFIERKAANAVRSRLSALLDVPRAYDLDRLDLHASSTLDGQVQQAATRLLRSLREPEGAKAAGLYGFRLLNEGDDTSKLVFSFTLFERAGGANLLRVQTDNVDQPFDLNEGARLDLGSTSKLRTLVTYLEMIAELHRQWSGLDPVMLAAQELSPRDALGRWAREWLLQAEDRSLQAMLNAAMERKYSASPGEAFYTGGGVHTFNNFEPEDDRKIVTVREALERSVNLPFIRMMRDIVYRTMAGSAKGRAALLEDEDHPERQVYLQRFADKEGREYLARFHRKYQGKDAAQAEALLLQGRRATPVRLAAVFFALHPQGDEAALAAFLDRHLPPGPRPAESAVRSLREKYGADRWSLGDRGYLAGVHPLELWLVGYLQSHPKAPWKDVVAASQDERQAAYEWLFKTRHKGAQDSRIRNLLEQEAFAEVARRWRRLGYPFESLTPSYASALGASGDRPASLAELMGILVNGGVRLPTYRVDELHFARATPYETRMVRKPAAGERVLPREVADTVRLALTGVVENGTAKRLKGVFRTPDGQPVPVGGKTGTGDHRFDVHGKGGALLSSRVVNRTATFAFFIGDRYFGTMMAYVHEPHAARYKFTSAMPSQLVKALSPTLLPLLDERNRCSVKAAPIAPAPATAAPRAASAPSATAAASASSAASAALPSGAASVPSAATPASAASAPFGPDSVLRPPVDAVRAAASAASASSGASAASGPRRPTGGARPASAPASAASRP